MSKPERYLAKLDELVAARRVAGDKGFELDDATESRFVAELNTIWDDMTAAEQSAAETAFDESKTEVSP